MLLLAHSVGRMSYLLRCLPPEALERVATEWDELLLSAATHVLAVAPTRGLQRCWKCCSGRVGWAGLV